VKHVAFSMRPHDADYEHAGLQYGFFCFAKRLVSWHMHGGNFTGESQWIIMQQVQKRAGILSYFELSSVPSELLHRLMYTMEIL
jgi:hypothetical protein